LSAVIAERDGTDEMWYMTGEDMILFRLGQASAKVSGANAFAVVTGGTARVWMLFCKFERNIGEVGLASRLSDMDNEKTLVGWAGLFGISLERVAFRVVGVDSTAVIGTLLTPGEAREFAVTRALARACASSGTNPGAYNPRDDVVGVFIGDRRGFTLDLVEGAATDPYRRIPALGRVVSPGLRNIAGSTGMVTIMEETGSVLSSLVRRVDVTNPETVGDVVLQVIRGLPNRSVVARLLAVQTLPEGCQVQWRDSFLGVATLSLLSAGTEPGVTRGPSGSQ
jgi:hypothetical protein